MVKIEISEEQRRNLLGFLNRVDLKGAEVPAYVDLINTINKEQVTQNKSEEQLTPNKK